MRIIAGQRGGLNLKTPQSVMRPTMDRVRGAIFSSLGEAVIGARVLDLFAGSGALGIEALSRGAASAVFVDSSPVCSSCIRQNLAYTKLSGSIQTMDALKFIELYAVDGFDLIFADPPYAKREGDFDFAAALMASPALAQAVKGTLILEIAATKKGPPPCPTLSLLRSRRYGASEIAYYIQP